MSKISKVQRREKRKKKESKRRLAHIQHSDESRLKGLKAPKMKFFQMPELFEKNLPWEQRLTQLRNVGSRAKSEFDENYPKLLRWMTDYDPVYVLSMCTFYCTTSWGGTDPELDDKNYFPHHYLEIMQAFSLCQPRSLSPTSLQFELNILQDDMTKIGLAMNLRHLDIPVVSTESEISKYLLRTEMMTNTTAVRNWAYQHQLRKVVLDLAMLVQSEFTAKYKVGSVAFFTLIFNLVDERTILLNTHISKVRNIFKRKNHREIVSAFNETFPENIPTPEEEADKIWEVAGRNRNRLKYLLIHQTDLKLSDIYSFSIDHVFEILGCGVERDSVKKLFNKLSYRFGDLENFDKNHIILGNPVLTHPFIQLNDEKYFTAMWSILPHLAMDLLEDLVWEDKRLKARYTKVKSDYLEDELECIVRAGFPNAIIHRGSLWIDPITKVQYENDVLVVIDGFALVLEAKSASVSAPARRGASERLTETLRGLIEAPSEQAHRFIFFLENHKQIHTFNTKHGSKNVVNSAAIKYYIPLGITLSQLGSISSNLKKLIKAGITAKQLEDLAPSINITDLESVMELLPLEVEKIHYFARRREFEAHMQYEGDELDLLGYYLDTGFNIGQSEYDDSITINMLLKSKELDPYFIGSREGKKIVKPSLSMTKWWRDMITRISEIRREGWVETGFILLNTTKEDQENFEKNFRILEDRIKQGKVDMEDNFVIGKFGPDRRRYVIVGYPYTTADRDIINTAIANIINGEFSDGARGIVVVGISLNSPIYPFNVLARKTSTNLFDILTL